MPSKRVDFKVVPGWPTESKFEKIVRSHTEMSRREAQQFLSGQYLEQEAPEELDSSEFTERLVERAKGLGAYGVMVMSRRDRETCSPCLNHDGEQYTIRDAHRHSPLPHRDCENDECRCRYMPILNDVMYTRIEGDEPDLPRHLDA